VATGTSLADLRIINMAMPKGSRIYRVGKKEYAVSVRGGRPDALGDVPLRISIRAHFGTRSCCTVRGLTNRCFWHDYPEIEEMRRNAVSITPRHVCALIVMAHSKGWNPETSKSSFDLPATREDIRALIAEQATANETVTHQDHKLPTRDGR
jgi:hypothetical protein